MKAIYVQYGCGHSAPLEWINFDISPTLRIQKTPVLNVLLKSRLNTVFPDNVRYGDIIRGLPVPHNSSDGIYCSHTLEHLSLGDFRTALKNTWRILKPGGIFRCVLPDLEYAAREYIAALDAGDALAAMRFMGPHTWLGLETRPRGLKGLVSTFWGNSKHLWMWDYPALSHELSSVGFKGIRRAYYNDSQDVTFKLVEETSRFENALAVECYKAVEC